MFGILDQGLDCEKTSGTAYHAMLGGRSPGVTTEPDSRRTKGPAPTSENLNRLGLPRLI